MGATRGGAAYRSGRHRVQHRGQRSANASRRALQARCRRQPSSRISSSGCSLRLTGSAARYRRRRNCLELERDSGASRTSQRRTCARHRAIAGRASKQSRRSRSSSAGTESTRYKARLAGWDTRSIRGVTFRHHRRVGQRDGAWRSYESQGATARFMGYRFSISSCAHSSGCSRIRVPLE